MREIFICSLLVCTGLSEGACSYLTARGRQEAAYARYVRHASAGRAKMQRKLAAFPKLPSSPPASEPVVTTSSGPESLTAANDSE